MAWGDCSARDPAIFDSSPALDPPTSVLGRIRSYRCTEFGVTCDGANLPRAAGSYTSCAPRGDSYLWSPQHQVDFLATLAPDPSRIVVSVIAGDPTPVSVTMNAQTPALAPSCTGPQGTAVPAVRLAAFAAAFPRGASSSLCAAGYDAAMAATAARVLCAGP